MRLGAPLAPGAAAAPTVAMTCGANTGAAADAGGDQQLPATEFETEGLVLCGHDSALTEADWRARFVTAILDRDVTEP
jgi:hypothetical protein